MPRSSMDWKRGTKQIQSKERLEYECETHKTWEHQQNRSGAMNQNNFGDRVFQKGRQVPACGG